MAIDRQKYAGIILAAIIFILMCFLLGRITIEIMDRRRSDFVEMEFNCKVDSVYFLKCTHWVLSCANDRLDVCKLVNTQHYSVEKGDSLKKLSGSNSLLWISYRDKKKVWFERDF